MTKVKEKLYEHRFGLFFFAIFALVGLVILDPLRTIVNTGVTYSFYCVDFSLGFCTKLLPGAIYNLLIGKHNETAITIYVKTLIIITFVLISYVFEKLLQSKKAEERREVFFYLCFAATGICFFFYKAGLVYLLDFHWIIATLCFTLCLSNKKLYIFIPLTFLYALMTHYVSIICYVAVCLLVLFYKAYITEEKKEKYLLFGIFAFSAFLSVALFLYMLLFELDNVRLSYPQFLNIIQGRGVEQTDYYIFAFFREAVEDIFTDRYNEETEGLILNIDQNQPLINILIQTVIQQFRINSYLANHKENIPQVCIFITGILLMVIDLVRRVKKAKFIEKLIYIAAILLFVFICCFGLLFSTDTIRWLGNAFLTLVVFFFSVLGFDKKERLNTNSVISDMSHGIYYFYFLLCVAFTLI